MGHQIRAVVGFSFSFGAICLFFSLQAQAQNDFERVEKLAALPYPVSVNADGLVKTDPKKWTSEKEGDGTELFTSVKTPQCKIAALRNASGLESFTSFALKSPLKGSDVKPESSSSVFFNKGKLSAITVCEDSGDKDSLGRTCVTATPKLCQNLHRAEPIDEDTLKEVDTYEMRALATILTLRGPDHQLDNVLRSGNRLGLKSALQTTKGQLVALARQVAKELETKPNRAPATEKKIVVSSPSSSASSLAGQESEESRTRTQLEHSIPRLKQACLDTGFME